MTMQKRAIAACLAAAVMLPMPAFAAGSRTGELTEKLNDPATQYAVAGMIAAMSKAVLDMKIAPFMKAMEGVSGKAARVPDDATIGDMAGTDADRVQDQLIERVPAMMSGAGHMAGAMEAMLPQLEEMARKMKDSMPRR